MYNDYQSENSLYYQTQKDYTDRQDARLIFKKWDEADTKFLGTSTQGLDEDLEELKELQEHEIYFS